MFRLIKMAIYGLVGYAVYEFLRGLMQGEDVRQAAGIGQRQGGSRELNEALDRDPARTNMTGPGRGERVMTAEASGESVPHVVGRGVVQR